MRDTTRDIEEKLDMGASRLFLREIKQPRVTLLQSEMNHKARTTDTNNDWNVKRHPSKQTSSSKRLRFTTLSLLHKSPRQMGPLRIPLFRSSNGRREIFSIAPGRTAIISISRRQLNQLESAGLSPVEPSAQLVSAQIPNIPRTITKHTVCVPFLYSRPSCGLPIPLAHSPTPNHIH